MSVVGRRLAAHCKFIYGALKVRIKRSLIVAASFILPYVSLRVLFRSAVFAREYELRGQRILLLHLISATKNLSYQTDSQQLNRLQKCGRGAPAILYAMGRLQNAVRAIQDQPPSLRDGASTGLMARALFDLGEFERARTVLSDSGGAEAFDFDPATAHLRGLLELLAGNEEDADVALRTAADDMPHLRRPHQNLAAKDPATYRPTRLDTASGRDGRFFDAYNYLGQRITHVGAGHLSTAIYAKAMAIQKRLQHKPPKVSAACAAYLKGLDISLADLVIFAPEWTAQIGHQGMLDVHLRMRDLGWWTGTPVVLVRHDRVANFAFLSLIANRVRMLSVGRTIPTAIADELISLQRYYGVSFNAFNAGWDRDAVVGGRRSGARSMGQRRPLPSVARRIRAAISVQRNADSDDRSSSPRVGNGAG